MGEQPRTEAERDRYRALNMRVVGASGREYKGEREESSGLTKTNSNLRRKPREVSVRCGHLFQTYLCGNSTIAL